MEQESLKTTKKNYFSCHMRLFINYLREYFLATNRLVLVVVTLFTALLVFCNYYFGVDGLIRSNQNFFTETIAWTFVFLLAFAMPYIIYGIANSTAYLSKPGFILLLLAAPVIFAIRISLPSLSRKIPFLIHTHWLPVINWLMSFIFIFVALRIIWIRFRHEETFYGIKGRRQLRPYLLILAGMLPLIVWASTLPGFAEMYPKLKLIEHTEPTAWEQLLFELSYGCDFFTVELFFRGFLVLAFAKWAGKDAILPMACFYCTIHFSKPLPECISSYWGGLLLGVIVYHTQSIWGGLLIHLGIAWAMEAAGLFF